MLSQANLKSAVGLGAGSWRLEPSKLQKLKRVCGGKEKRLGEVVKTL